MTQQLQTLIDQAWEQRTQINALNAPEVREAVEHVIADLNAGRIRVAQRQGVGQWTVNQWVKKSRAAELSPARQQDHALWRPGVL